MDFNSNNQIPNYQGSPEPLGDQPSNSNFSYSREPANGFARASMILGLLSIVTAFMLTIYFPFVLGSLAIILALLSKGYQSKLHPNAKTAIATAIVGLSLNICLIAGSFILVFSVKEYREQFDTIFEQVYGESFDDALDDMIDSNTP